MSILGRIEEVWYGSRGGVLAAFLAGLSWPYRAGVGVREAFYRTGLRNVKELPVPCVSVGNIVVGGAGKTPVVSWVVEQYRRAGHRPAVISRGYGGSYRGAVRVIPEKGGSARLFGDEPVMLAREHPQSPVIVARDRWLGGLLAVGEHGATVLVADDAFQHRRLARDLDLVVVDAGRGFGNGRLLPHGPLREKKKSLGRADIILLNRVSGAGVHLGKTRAELRRLAPDTPIVEGDVVPSRWRAFDREAAGQERPASGGVFAFCGLANPRVFLRTLEEESIPVTGWREFQDHHPYEDKEIRSLGAEAERSGAGAAVTTAKDAVRIGEWKSALPLYVLDVRFEVRSAGRLLEDTLLRVAGRSER